MLDDVEKLVARLSPDPICDGCIAGTLGLGDPHYAGHRARALAGSNGFERRKQVCSMCGIEQVSIRQQGR